MRTLTALLVASVLVIAGCGSSNKNAASSSSGGATATPAAPSGGGQQLALAAPADGSLKFDKKTLSAKAGTVTIALTNPSSTPHGISIEGNGVDQDSNTVSQSKTSVTAKLKPGTYTFYCPVPGHRQAGMVGKLVVK